MRKISILSFVVVFILLISGCSSNTSNKTANGLTKIKFVQDFPQPAWGAQIPWIVAQEKGFYKDEGLDVQMVWPPTPSDPMKFVSTGKVDLGMSYTPDILTGASQGLNVKAVASLLDQDNGGLMFWDDQVKKPKDIEGKTVAIYDIPMTKLHFDTFLKHYGIDKSKVKVVSAGDYSAPLMIAKKIDGGDAAAASEKVTVEKETGKKLKFFLYDETSGIPKRYWFVMIGNPSFVQKNPKAVKAFVKATLKGLQYAKDHPDEAVSIFAKKYPDLGKDVIAAQWKEMELSFPRFEKDKPEGYMDTKIWDGYMNYFVKNGLLDSKVDVNKIVTNDYLPKQ